MDQMPESPPPSRTAPLSPLRDAQAWLFDLDNTLYSATIDLFAQIDDKMRAYIADFLGLDIDQAYALQKKYFYEYGTSMRGLMDRHGMDPAPFLAHVHDIDVSVLDPSPELSAALTALPGRKLIFTNASTQHADRVLRPTGRRPSLRRRLRHHRRRLPAEAGAGDLPQAAGSVRHRSGHRGDGGGHGSQPRCPPRRWA